MINWTGRQRIATRHALAEAVANGMSVTEASRSILVTLSYGRRLWKEIEAMHGGPPHA